MSISLTVLALLSLPAADTAKPYPHPELLIEAAELAKPEVARGFRILDARGRGGYNEGHVPGAVWVDVTTWGREFARQQDADAWAKRLGELGLDLDTRVVLYDDAPAKDAARIWWILRYWGVRDVRLVNGGWTAWKEINGPVVPDEPKVTATAPKLKPQADRLATKDQLLDILATGKAVQIVDARSREEYCGESDMAQRNGAIPGALNKEWNEALDKKTQRFKSAEELAKLLAESGIDLTKPTVTYCQSGGRASVMAFTLELMGAKDVRNYYRSWAEWGNAKETPIAKPKANP
jgi:thiosulfate/3-mercaptopyruvate sulfurtransferase